jgi:hypothetical protein
MLFIEFIIADLTRLPMQFINFGQQLLLSLLHQQKPVQSRLLPFSSSYSLR